ncbi:AcrR family transcriptional regulator [Amycolatopsis jiangsuensis]|uniref:AcrR family transcriptional regulator n=2 Tax=Amycolatopsis jiangsuensis TaxID=1181879 RepID=A0A840J620_9PSEU|nr:AcrR family transcriptional regulator [Amycolatopsis jiangsuensis]
MDRLTAAAEVSSRTLYKHVGSKNALIAAVLKQRCVRFFDKTDVDSVDALFAALGDWNHAEGTRGCMFLRAQGETGGETPEVSEVVAEYRRILRELIDRIVTLEIGSRRNDVLVEQVLVLFEGATSVASYSGADAVSAARAAAATLVKAAR